MPDFFDLKDTLGNLFAQETAARKLEEAQTTFALMPRGQRTVEDFLSPAPALPGRVTGERTVSDYLNPRQVLPQRPIETAGSQAAPLQQIETAGSQATPPRSWEGGDLVPNQFGDATLTPAQAAAACGPAAAVAFARATGRNPTLSEALNMAKTTGWTEAGGMNGIGNQAKLLSNMGIPHRVTSQVDWSAVATDARNGNPVTISTPQHYFVIDGVDEQGRYHVGPSGTAFKAGAAWMTQQQIQQLGRGVNGAIFLDSPASPQPSVAVTGARAPVGVEGVPLRAAPGGSFSPYDEVFRRYAPGSLAEDPQFLGIVASGAFAESGFDPRRSGDNGRSKGLFQLHEAGAGAGLGDSRYDPEVQARVMLPRYAAAYQKYAGMGYTGAQLAAWTAAEAERPFEWQNPQSKAQQNYRNAYAQIVGGGR